MKLVCVMHNVYNDVVLFEVIDSNAKTRFSVWYHSNIPILIHQYGASRAAGNPKFRLCSDKASLLQLRRMKQLTNSDFTEFKELQPDDMASKVMELIGVALVARMDEIFTEA